jgi:multidrug efflux pump subunit AcrA (membrane-fusion protein)
VKLTRQYYNLIALAENISKTIRASNEVAMKKFSLSFLLLSFLFIFTACFALPAEEPVLPPPLLPLSQITEYRTVPVTRGDVALYRDLSVSYVAVQEEAYSFELNDVYINNIQVAVGDTVTQGQILAELDRTAIQQQLENAGRDKTWTELHLRQLDETQAMNVLIAEVTGQAADDSAYRQQRAAYENDLEMNRIRTEYLQFENERRLLRSNIDGTVSSVMPFRLGDTSTADQRVVTVADQTQSIFSVRGTDINLLEVGRQYVLKVNNVEYMAEVIDPSAINRYISDEAYLQVLDTGGTAFNTRSYGSVHVVLAEVKNVLKLPKLAVHFANGRVFVYLLEDGMRTIRDVEAGLEGTAEYEIKSGLTTDDIVILD